MLIGEPHVTPKTLEELSDRSMPGRERQHIGDWVCRAANGVTGRANSCTALGDPGTSPARAIAAAEDWFLDRGLRPLFQIWDGCDGGVIAALDERGYVFGEGADVLTLDLNRTRWTPPSAPVVVAEGRSDQIEGVEVTDRLEELAMSSLPKLVATIPAEAGRGVVSSGIGVIDGSALGIFAMRTEPDHQRSGMASSVLVSLLAAGEERGADTAWLQVMPTNASAKRLYAGFGFQHGLAYHCRAAPKLP